MPKGFRRQAPYSSRLDYGLLLIYLTGKFSYLSITISWAWGLEKTILGSLESTTPRDIWSEIVGTQTQWDKVSSRNYKQAYNVILNPLSGDLCKSGTRYFASEKSFPSNFA